MQDLQQLRDVLGILGSIALIVGVVIGVLQLRALRSQRQVEQVLRAYMPFLEENLTRAYWRVHNWDYTAFDDFQQRATLDDWTDLDQVTTFFEMMGVFYKRGVAKLDLLDDLFAGSLMLMWAKLAPLVRGYRIQNNVNDYGLRFELLAEALDQRLTERGEPHAAFR
jgi:hypothetical protein